MVAERFCSIWWNIQKITKYCEAIPKKSNQNARVTKGTKDELTLAK